MRDHSATIAAICAGGVDRVCERGECDLVVDIATPLPLLLIAALLGVTACILAIKRGARKLGITGIVALVSFPLIPIASAFLDSTFSSWCELSLPIGLVLAFLVFVAGLITTILAAHQAQPEQ